MKIDKISNSTYKISNLVRTNIISDVLTLFDISSHNDGNIITISGINSLTTFKEWEKKLEHPLIDYIQAEQIFDNFAAISLYLEKIGMQLSHLNPDNIIVINNSHFIPLNFDNLFIIKNDKITIDTLYNKKNPYLSLDLIDNNSIPFVINFKCFYSSLALLIYDKLIGITKNSDFEQDLLVIYGTRLYWMLRYSFEKKPEDRLIIIM